jgi:hypothetical protein
MANGPRRRTGFAGRPLALRRELLAVLGKADNLTATELAAFAFSGRVCRSRTPSCSPAQLASTRRALRRLLANGRVDVVGYCRRHRLFALTGRTAFPPLDVGVLDG